MQFNNISNYSITMLFGAANTSFNLDNSDSVLLFIRPSRK